MKMINNFRWVICLVAVLTLTSCSWEELPEYDQAEISQVNFRYRWPSTDYIDDITGEPLILEVGLTTNASIDSETGTINVVISVPAAQSYFTQAVRDGISLSNLCCQVTLSTAAKIAPTDNHKVLGIPDDWTSPHAFVVTAANGTKKNWTINVTSLNK